MTRFSIVSVCACAIALIAVRSSGADRVVLARLGPTEGTLFISNADGSEQEPLTQASTLDYDPAWSPQGDWIAFTSERAGSADLYRIHPDGTGLERLTDDPAYDDQAAFSADEKRVVFVSTRGGGRAHLWILDLNSKKVTVLTKGEFGDFRPSWSPDGQWIAFSSDRDGDFRPAKGRWERLQLADVYVVHPDGSGLKRITQGGGFCGSPKWTADSKSVVAYCMPAQDDWTFRAGDQDGNDELVKIDVASGQTTPMHAGAGVKIMPTVLASGKVGYVRYDKTVNGVFYSDGTGGPVAEGLHSASWSPDGKKVVYGVFKTVRSKEPVKLWSRDANFDLYGTGILPAYDASGAHLAVTLLKPNMMSSTLTVVDEGQPARTILDRDDLILAPQWSADGKQLVVGVGPFTAFLDFTAGDKKPVDRVNGGAQVAVLNTDGTGFHVVTGGPNNNAFASFSPDGKSIVYRTAGPAGDGLRVLNLADHAERTLTTEYDNFPIWSPRGDLIAFIRKQGDDFNVCTIHADGTGLKQLTHTKGNEAHLAWSPDGERLLFTSSRTGFKDEVLYENAPQPYGEIFVMRKDGTQIEQLTDDQWEEGGPAWQPHLPGPAAASAK